MFFPECFSLFIASFVEESLLDTIIYLNYRYSFCLRGLSIDLRSPILFSEHILVAY